MGSPLRSPLDFSNILKKINKDPWSINNPLKPTSQNLRENQWDISSTPAIQTAQDDADEVLANELRHGVPLILQRPAGDEPVEPMDP